MLQETAVPDQIVKKRQIEVLSIAEGFFQSSVLFALLKLKVFELIDRGSTTLQELAAELNARPETLLRLLNAGVVLKLLESGDGVNFGIAPTCQAVLKPSAGEYYLGDWIRSLDYFYTPISKLDEAVLNSAPTIDPAAHLGGDKDKKHKEFYAFHAQLCIAARKGACRFPEYGGVQIAVGFSAAVPERMPFIWE
jgi:hypothetical protein